MVLALVQQATCCILMMVAVEFWLMTMTPDGPLTNKRVLFEGEKHQTGSDGATVDSDGNLWVALTGSSEIGMMSPEGELLKRISMPVKLPSSVMFGGRDLDELLCHIDQQFWQQSLK